MTSSLIQRYEKTFNNCALFHLEKFWAIELKGSDTKDYLQRISTADFRSCTAGQAIQTLFLKADGRLVADCIAICIEEIRFLLICRSTCGLNLLEQLDKYLFTEDVEITNITDTVYVGALVGPNRNTVLSKYSCSNPQTDTITASVSLAPALSMSLIVFMNSTFEINRHRFYEKLKSADVIIGDKDLFRAIRIEAGTPEYGHDTSEKTIPLEAGLNSAISFTKGCFPGQEIVARINNLGHPANVLVGLELPETTKELVGCELYADEKLVGKITSSCFSPLLSRYIGLGYTKWALREAGTSLRIAGDENYLATVITVPVRNQ